MSGAVPGARAAALFALSRPVAPEIHLVESGAGCHVLAVDGTRLYDLDRATFDRVRAAVADGRVGPLLSQLGLDRPEAAIGEEGLRDPPVRALSLAVAQRCNLGCAYCYAQEGGFGAAPQIMSAEVAARAVDLLLAETAPGDRVHLSFLGGEPLTNRPVLRETTRHAARAAAQRGVGIGFAITSNGTLIDADDGAFFEEHGFAVTISLDGPQAVHDRLRPHKGGRGSFETILHNVRPLLAAQRRMQVSARVTVTPANLALRQTLDDFVALGFHSVGFSPLLTAPSGRGEMTADDLLAMLDAMVECGIACERRTLAGERYPFANFLIALKEIHKGTHRPYPCGAGAGYLAVSATGDLSACHRFVGNPVGALGNLTGGVDRARRNNWLEQRHVGRQEPCRSCWARYLCGGGCHHEVIHRGRPACDYIRGWLHYCLGAYARLAAARADLFTAAAGRAA